MARMSSEKNFRSLGGNVNEKVPFAGVTMDLPVAVTTLVSSFLFIVTLSTYAS